MTDIINEKAKMDEKEENQSCIQDPHRRHSQVRVCVCVREREREREKERERG